MVIPGPMSISKEKPARSTLSATSSPTNLNVLPSSQSGLQLRRKTLPVFPMQVLPSTAVSTSATTAEKLATRARLAHKTRSKRNSPRFCAISAERKVIVFATVPRNARSQVVLARSVRQKITWPKIVPTVRSVLVATVVRKTTSPRTVPTHASKPATTAARKAMSLETASNHARKSTGPKSLALSGKWTNSEHVSICRLLTWLVAASRKVMVAVDALKLKTRTVAKRIMLQLTMRAMVVVGRPTIPAALHRLIGSKAAAVVVALMLSLLRPQVAVGKIQRDEMVVQYLDLCDNILAPTIGR